MYPLPMPGGSERIGLVSRVSLVGVGALSEEGTASFWERDKSGGGGGASGVLSSVRDGNPGLIKPSRQLGPSESCLFEVPFV